MKLKTIAMLLCVSVSALRAVQVSVDIDGVSRQLTFDESKLAVGFNGKPQGSVEGTLEQPVSVKVLCGTGGYRPAPGAPNPVIGSFDYEGTRCIIFKK